MASHRVRRFHFLSLPLEVFTIDFAEIYFRPSGRGNEPVLCIFISLRHVAESIRFDYYWETLISSHFSAGCRCHADIANAPSPCRAAFTLHIFSTVAGLYYIISSLWFSFSFSRFGFAEGRWRLPFAMPAPKFSYYTNILRYG